MKKTHNGMLNSMALELVLADTVIWCDHAKQWGIEMHALSKKGLLAVHEHTVVEYGLGSLGAPAERARRLAKMRQRAKVVPCVHSEEMLREVSALGLGGSGLDFVDVQILITALRYGYTVWTRDKALMRACDKVGVQLFCA